MGMMVGMGRAIMGALIVLLLAGACATAGDGAEPPPEEEPVGGLEVTEVTGGLEHGWDVGFLPDGGLLVTERPGTLKLLSGGAAGARLTEVSADFSDVLATGEGGLMGLVVHPDFAESRRFTTCQTHEESGRAVDVRLVTWRLAGDGTGAERVRTLVDGLPLNPSGRHSGCRPVIGPDGELLVGTGDTARPGTAQDRSGLGGKVLRVDLGTGAGLPDNPFADAADENTRRILSYGHRNIQGIAVQPGTGRIYTAEHGPDVDDEVNRIEPGGNYGWDPSQGGTVDFYDESVPMTDLDRFPDAVLPVWATGDMTEAICGADFLRGEQWGDLEGALAVVALKGSKLILLTLDEAGTKVRTKSEPAELAGSYGRLRAARTGPDGALYVTSSNGADDVLLRIAPR